MVPQTPLGDLWNVSQLKPGGCVYHRITANEPMELGLFPGPRIAHDSEGLYLYDREIGC